MSIVVISNPNLNEYGVSGSGATFTFTDDLQFVKLTESGGYTLLFDKSTMTLTGDADGRMIIADSTQSFQFVYAQAGYATVAAAITAIDAMKQNMPTASVTFPTGTETPTATLVTDSAASPVVAGKTAVTFTTSSDFAGTILGVARLPNVAYCFTPTSMGKTLSSIAYTVTAGSMTIDVQS